MKPRGEGRVRCSAWLGGVVMASASGVHAAHQLVVAPVLLRLLFWWRRCGLQLTYLVIAFRYRCAMGRSQIAYLFGMGLLHLKYLSLQAKRLRMLLVQCRMNYLLLRLYLLDKRRCLSVLRLLAEDGQKVCDLVRSRSDNRGVHSVCGVTPPNAKRSATRPAGGAS